MPISAPPANTPAVHGDLLDALQLFVVLFFLVLAVHKEVVSGGPADWSRNLCRGLDIALVPLGVSTLFIIGSRIVEISAS